MITSSGSLSYPLPSLINLNSPESLLNRLSTCSSPSHLKQIHAVALRTTNPTHPESLFLFSRILHSQCAHDLPYARRLFDQLPLRNSFIWNTLIGAYARSPNKEEAVELYRDFLEDSECFPDKHTFPVLLKACAYLFRLSLGVQAHAQSVKLGLSSDVYISNSLIHFYASCGRKEDARKVFDKMPERNLVSWNALIDGVVRDGDFEASLFFFSQMQPLFQPDEYTIQSILAACAGSCSLSSGMWLHAYITKLRNPSISNSVLINNSLIEMYSKCGSISLALQVFDEMAKRDVNSFNAIILALSSHGQWEQAIHQFTRMADGPHVRPNSITFVGLLSACSHCSKVNEGRRFFSQMVNEYKIEPTIEHFGCLVDMFARANLHQEALDTVTRMPMKPDAAIWRSLLDGLLKNKSGDVDLSEGLFNRAMESDGGDCSGVYVMLSKVYASASRWDDVGLVRNLMSSRGVKKEPGCSVIEINGASNEFFSGDTSHPRVGDIYGFLGSMEERLRRGGYEVDDDVAVRGHSERLAMALGLMESTRGAPIRIYKNLQVCRDCHEFSKGISKVFGVEIIMRDRVRFHRFEDGSCSCRDCW